MSQEFSFKRDFKSIMWKETLLINLTRSFFAGLVWVVILSTNMGWEALILLLFPLMYFFVYLPIGLVASFLSSIGIPFAGLISAFISLFIIPGDPFVYFLRKIQPEWVPIDSFNPINFVLILFVTQPIEESLSEASES